jgi:hypothetical protein
MMRSFNLLSALCSVPNLIAIQIDRRIDPKNNRSTGLQKHWPIDPLVLSLDPDRSVIGWIDCSIRVTFSDGVMNVYSLA